MFLGENIFKLVDDEFAVQRIPWKHCLSFGCGSASVTTGWKKGVISFVRQQHEHVHMSGSWLHLVHLAAKKGATDDILVDIFYYFKKSVNHQTELKHLQALYDDNQCQMLKHICTRWLSNSRYCFICLLNQKTIMYSTVRSLQGVHQFVWSLPNWVKT